MQLAPTIHAKLNEQPTREFWERMAEQSIVRKLDAADKNPLLESAM